MHSNFKPLFPTIISTPNFSLFQYYHAVFHLIIEENE